MTSSLKKSFSQETSFITANVGGTATLQCFREDSIHVQFFMWFKQSLGLEPKLISTFYEKSKGAIFQTYFDKEGRFKVETEDKKHHLTIKNLHASDSAMYYCASNYVNTFTFGNGTFVSVRGSGTNNTALVYQPSSDGIQSEDSLTMSCTVQTASCVGQHSVHWFRGSGESHPGLIYTQRGSNEPCERKKDKANTQPHMCVYSMKGHNFSQAETNCAVAACGQAVFRIGSKLNNECEYLNVFSTTLPSVLPSL